jgi:hypothetical protein
MRYEFRPLGDWVGGSTAQWARSPSRFKASYDGTLDLLFAEAEKLGAKHLVLQVDLQERDIRVDGLPRANARYGSHPGVVVSFESRYGPLRYATDEFTDWRANLRAIALALEALRAVDRYGVTKRGEQYQGWRAIEAPRGSVFADADAAEKWMRGYADVQLRLAATPLTGLGGLYRMMARRMHPDMGGPRADWDRLDEARRMLKEAGRL